MVFTCSALLMLLATPAAMAQAQEGTGAQVMMDARHGANVRYYPRHNSSVVAKVEPGSTLALLRTAHRAGCSSVWYMRPSGGYICGDSLRPSSLLSPRPGPGAAPDIRSGMSAWQIGRGGSRLYRSRVAVDKRHMLKLLYAHSILTVAETTARYGTPWLVTRKKKWASAENAERLNPAPVSLGVSVPRNAVPPVGIIIGEDTRLFDKPAPDSRALRTLPRWSWIDAGNAGIPTAKNGWVALPDGGHVRDEDIARLRNAPVPADLAPDEKWISVDLEEQLLVAWEGRRIVRMVPCSTGIKDNTPTGSWRVQWKRRIQTMNARGGHEIVEDVQWVMYYLKRRGIAIHAAYWHDQFGRRRSHGCVNLPEQDARWLYEWSGPHASPEDAETFAVPAGSGTRVIVF